MNESAIVEWEASPLCVLKYFYIKSLDYETILDLKLEDDQKNLNIVQFIHQSGSYELSLYYEINGETFKRKIIVTFEE